MKIIGCWMIGTEWMSMKSLEKNYKNCLSAGTVQYGEKQLENYRKFP